MSELATIACPYSRALFEVAKKNNAISLWQSYLKNLAAIAKNADVISILTNPRADKATKIGCFRIVDNLPSHIDGLLTVLADVNRLLLLPQIIDKYMRLCDEDQHIIKAELTSAKSVCVEFLARLEENLNSRYKAKVMISTKIDETLLGGGVLRVGDDVIDVSLRTKLQKLKQEMLG